MKTAYDNGKPWTNACWDAVTRATGDPGYGPAMIMEVSAGTVLYRRQTSIQNVYFPLTAIVSLLFSTAAGDTSGLALTGREGFVGFPLVLGRSRACHDAVVQNPGQVLRVQRADFLGALERVPEFRRVTMGYVRTVMAQLQSGLICSQHYRVEEQLARWLLLSFDRACSSRLSLTQQVLADLLGVRREAVNEAAQKLSERGMIHYGRGWIDVLEPEGLRELVRECYPPDLKAS